MLDSPKKTTWQRQGAQPSEGRLRSQLWEGPVEANLFQPCGAVRTRKKEGRSQVNFNLRCAETVSSGCQKGSGKDDHGVWVRGCGG